MTTLDGAEAEIYANRALDAGATGPQLHEARQIKKIMDAVRGQRPLLGCHGKRSTGVLDALPGLSPEAFEAFFVYCAVPWKTSALAALTKELISMALDAAPTQRYAPGMRLQLANALRLGAGKTAIRQALDIAVFASNDAKSGWRR